MMKSLNTKLSLLLLSLFIVVGVLLALITRCATIQYNLEITQRLNASIAMYIAEEQPLIINGKYNATALKKLADRAMVINPTVEVYVLDKKGYILGHNLSTDNLQLKQIPLSPITQFLTDESERPILNKDPRSPDNDKTFSVAKIINNEIEEGYIYVVLGGKKYEAIINDISTNYILKLALSAIALVILLALLIGVLVLLKLTKPLRTLHNQVITFQQQSTEKKLNYSGDEIQQLNHAFDDMSARIARQLDQIKYADQARRELITNVSHDLRTPLSSMQGYLDTLLIKQQDLDAETTTKYLRVARKHCGRLSMLVNDLFELSKLDSNAINLRVEAFSMAELIQDVAMEFMHQAKHKNITLSMRLPQGNTNVLADIRLMQRVLENLIGNALKHTAANGRILLELKAIADGFTMAVSDNGRGISQSDLPNIFNRLYRADNTSHESSTSSGLGLAIVKKILDIHQITIEVKSELNRGTKFSFYLPVAA